MPLLLLHIHTKHNTHKFLHMFVCFCSDYYPTTSSLLGGGVVSVTNKCNVFLYVYIDVCVCRWSVRRSIFVATLKTGRGGGKGYVCGPLLSTCSKNNCNYRGVVCLFVCVCVSSSKRERRREREREPPTKKEKAPTILSPSLCTSSNE